MAKDDNLIQRPRPRRRCQTAGEKEALRLKRLRDEFGTSAIDPDEPELSPAFPCGALACAFKDAQQIHAKPGKRFNPKALVKRTAAICPLTEDQQKELERWLRWLSDRRYVTRDGYQSPVLQWLLSAPAMNSPWPGDADGIWRAKVDEEHERRLAANAAKEQEKAKKDAKAREEAENASVGAGSEESEKSHSDAQSPASDGDRADEDTVPDWAAAWSVPGTKEAEPVGYDRSSLYKTETKTVAAESLRRPDLPYGAFRSGEVLANKFFEALRDASDAELVARATNLSQDADAARKAMARSNDVARCIEQVFEQIGLPLPEANR